MAQDSGRQTYTIREVSRLLGLSRNATYAACRKRQIPALRIGRRLVIPVAAVNRMLETPAPSPRPTEE